MAEIEVITGKHIFSYCMWTRRGTVTHAVSIESGCCDYLQVWSTVARKHLKRLIRMSTRLWCVWPNPLSCGSVHLQIHFVKTITGWDPLIFTSVYSYHRHILSVHINISRSAITAISISVFSASQYIWVRPFYKLNNILNFYWISIDFLPCYTLI